MKVEEAMKLKPGDLVMIRWKKAATIYKNLVYEVVNTRSEGKWKAWVEVKQPGFDMGFRDTISASLLKRYEDVLKEAEFHCGVEESGGHAYNCNDCPNKCEEWHQWDKEDNK